MWVSEQWGVFTEQTEKSSQAPPSHAPPQEGLVCKQHRTLPDGAAQALPGPPAGLGLGERVRMQGGYGAVCTPAPPGEAHGWGVPGLISQFAPFLW